MPSENKQGNKQPDQPGAGPLGAGLDIGTMNLFSARKNAEEKVVTRRMRDAFLDLPLENKQFLKLSDVNYIEKDGKVFIIGDEALHVANMFSRNVRRPMSRGVISPSETDSYDVLSLMIEQLLGQPRCERELCYFSVPAPPIDDPDQDIIFHEGVFKRLVEELGYEARPMNEAAAICFSEAKKEENFSALTISFGAGMVNVALTYRTISPMKFSIARGGDWIDAQTAKAANMTASRVAALKEKHANLADFKEGDPKTQRAREALQLYYKALIDYTLEKIVEEFGKVQDNVDLPDPIPLIVSGGTSMAKGFVTFFRQQFEAHTGFPIAISEVRQAADPMGAVAKGLLVNATVNY